jgi:pimeloyl-ACP methyl ester carboxylesterase
MQNTEDIRVQHTGDTLSRRRLLQALVTALAPAAVGMRVRAAQGQATTAELGPYSSTVLPTGVRSRFVDDVNGLRMHILEAGFETPGRPGLLLLHGFPELAYSWRKNLGPLAAAGYHAFAPDVRGYGRTSGANVKYTDDLKPFGTVNKIHDMLALVSALGYRSVAGVIGHDQGSPLAGWCALARPDVFRSVVMMSAPFGGAPAIPFNTANAPRAAAPRAAADPIYDELAKLTPPRKHYQRYYQTPGANEDLWHPPQGIHAFLRGYYHMKSADWKENQPHPLAGRTATEWAKLPRYYVMDLNRNRGCGDAVTGRDRRVPMAARRRAPRVQRRVRQDRIPRRPQRLSRHPDRCRSADLFRPDDRYAVALHRREERLGRLPKSGCARAATKDGDDEDARHASRRGRRPLGTAGTARGCEPPAAGVPPARGLARSGGDFRTG